MTQTNPEPALNPSRGEEPGRIPYRVNIGVTGHRDLANEAALASRVGAHLERVCEWFLGTRVTSTPITILSALAEGADRLVARVAPVALSGATVELQPVLPLVARDYLQDFADQTSRRDFEELLGASLTPIELADAWTQTKAERLAAYERAGRYIVDHSDVLIAVYDGRASGGRGGTKEVMDYAHDRGVPVVVVPADQPETGTDRSLPGIPEPFAAPAPMREGFRRVDEYNRLSLRVGRPAKALEASYARLDFVLHDVSLRGRCQPVLDRAVPHLVRADALAMKYQFWYRALGRSIYVLAAFAVAAVAAQTVFAPKATGWLGFEIGLLLLLIAALWIGRRSKVHERWMGYRSLAEAFRSALFLSISNAAEVSEHQERARAHTPWFQRAFSEAWAHWPDVSLEESDASDLYEFLASAWIKDQIAFHEATVRRSEARRRLYTWIVSALAGVTIVVAALHIVHVPSGAGWTHVFELLAIMLPGFGAAVTGLREQGHHRLHEERSKRAAERLGQLLGQGEADPDLADVRKLALAAHHVIEDEKLNWSSVLEFQELELVL